MSYALIAFALMLSSSTLYAGEIQIQIPGACNDPQQSYACLQKSMPHMIDPQFEAGIKGAVTWSLIKDRPQYIHYAMQAEAYYLRTHDLKGTQALIKSLQEEDRNARLSNGPLDFSKSAEDLLKGELGSWKKVVGTGASLTFDAAREVDNFSKNHLKDMTALEIDYRNEQASSMGLTYIQGLTAKAQKDPEYAKIYNSLFVRVTGLPIQASMQIFLDKEPILNASIMGLGNLAEKMNQNNQSLTSGLGTLTQNVKNLQKTIDDLTKKSQKQNGSQVQPDPQEERKKLKASLREIDGYKTFFDGASSILGTCRSEDCSKIKKVAALGSATASFADALTRYKSKDSENSITGVAMAGATMNWVGVAMAIFQSAQPSESQMIMEQLGIIQQQIQKLTEIVVAGFERVERQNTFHYLQIMSVLDTNRRLTAIGIEGLSKQIEESDFEQLKKDFHANSIARQDALARCLKGKEDFSLLKKCWSSQVIASFFLNQEQNAYNAGQYLLRMPKEPNVQDTPVYFSTLYRKIQDAHGAQLKIFDQIHWDRIFQVIAGYLAKHPELAKDNVVRKDLKQMLVTGERIQGWLASLFGPAQESDLGIVGREIEIYKKHLKQFKKELLAEIEQAGQYPGDIARPRGSSNLEGAKQDQLPKEIGLCKEFSNYAYARIFKSRMYPTPEGLADRIHPEILSYQYLHGGSLEACYRPRLIDGGLHWTGAMPDWEYFATAHVELIVRYYPPSSEKDKKSPPTEYVVFHAGQKLFDNYIYLARTAQYDAAIEKSLTNAMPKFDATEESPIYMHSSLKVFIETLKETRETNLERLQKIIVEKIAKTKAVGQPGALLEMSQAVFRLKLILRTALSASQQNDPIVVSALSIPTYDTFHEEPMRMSRWLTSGQKAEEEINMHLDALQENLRALKRRTKTFGSNDFAYQLEVLRNHTR